MFICDKPIIGNVMIDHFGKELAFTYSRDKKNSQLFYLSSIQLEATIQLRYLPSN